MKTLAICVLLWLVHVSMVSSLITNHSCAYYNTAPKIPFDRIRYSGLWFIHQLYDWSYPGLSSAKYNCYVEIRTPLDAVFLDHIEILINPDEPRLQFPGKVKFDQPEIGHYTYSYGNDNDFSNAYDILATDYITYAIESNCIDQVGGGSDCYVYVMSRFPVVLSFTQNEINKVLDKYHFDKNKLRTTKLLSCPAEFLKISSWGGLLGSVVGLLGGVGGLLGRVGGLLGGLLGLVKNLLGAILALVTNLLGAILPQVTNLLG